MRDRLIDPVHGYSRYVTALLFALAIAAHGHAATIYIDASMVGDCTSGNYSIANRNCTGSDGRGYNDIAAARAASANGDTIYLRAGTHAANTGGEGIIPKTNQVWRTYPGDMPTRAQVNSSLKRVFTWYQVNGVQIRDLVMVGGTDECIWAGGYNGLVIDNTECRGWNTSALDYHHGFKFGFGGVGAVVTNNWIHSPAAAGPANEYAGLSWGDHDSGHVVEYNLVEGTGMGIWIDVNGGNPASGLTPHIVRFNRVQNIARYCFHVEVGSTGTFQHNIADGCGQVAFFMRPGGGTTTQLKIQHNTFYNYSISGIHLQQDGASGKLTNSNVENNILHSAGGYSIVVGANTADDASNVFRNNLIHTANNAQGVCWRKGTGSGFGCDSTSFADTAAGIASWQAAAGPKASNNIAGDPLFVNAPAGDFRLRATSPARNAGTNGTDIGAVQYIDSLPSAPTNLNVSM